MRRPGGETPGSGVSRWRTAGQAEYAVGAQGLKTRQEMADTPEVMARRVFVTSQLALLVASCGVAALTSRAADWREIPLVLLLAGLALVSDALAIEARGQRLSGSFIALVLAMAFLGPAPAVAIGLLTILVDVVRTRWRGDWVRLLTNLAAYATFPLVGALLIRWPLSVSP